MATTAVRVWVAAQEAQAVEPHQRPVKVSATRAVGPVRSRQVERAQDTALDADMAARRARALNFKVARGKALSLWVPEDTEVAVQGQMYIVRAVVAVVAAATTAAVEEAAVRLAAMAEAEEAAVLATREDSPLHRQPQVVTQVTCEMLRDELTLIMCQGPVLEEQRPQTVETVRSLFTRLLQHQQIRRLILQHQQIHQQKLRLIHLQIRQHQLILLQIRQQKLRLIHPQLRQLTRRQIL